MARVIGIRYRCLLCEELSPTCNGTRAEIEAALAQLNWQNVNTGQPPLWCCPEHVAEGKELVAAGWTYRLAEGWHHPECKAKTYSKPLINEPQQQTCEQKHKRFIHGFMWGQFLQCVLIGAAAGGFTAGFYAETSAGLLLGASVGAVFGIVLGVIFIVTRGEEKLKI